MGRSFIKVSGRIRDQSAEFTNKQLNIFLVSGS